MHGSIKKQLLIPFAAGLAALAVVIGIASVMAARGAAKQELRTRADRAETMVAQTIARTRTRLASDSRLFTQVLEDEPVRGRELDKRLIRFAVERDLSHVSILDGRDRFVGGDGRRNWTRLGTARRLRVRANRSGRAVTTTGVSDQNEPMVLAAATSGRNGPTTLLGRAIDRKLLRPVEASTGVLVQIEPAGAAGSEDGSLQNHGTNTFERRLSLSGVDTKLLISTSDLRVAAATWSILMVTGGGGILVLLLLLLFLQLLVGRSVVSPVRSLAGGLRRVQSGDHRARLELEGAEELRLLAEGFNEMTATVGSQHQRLEQLAATDNLTGLANHRAFHDALNRALVIAERDKQPLGLMAADLDHFKALNDTHGHTFGDDVLRLVAASLREAVRETDLVGRVGGEEFAVLLPATDGDTALKIAERARRAVEAIELPGVAVNCSAGVAIFPDDTLDGRELLHLADSALYAAKEAGRGRTFRYEPHHAFRLTPDEQREQVRSLLSRPELIRSMVQPIVSLADGEIVGYEALTRFEHPSGRSPHKWFGLARRSGLGPELQALAIKRALAITGRPPGTLLSVNLDPSALATPAIDAALPQDLTGILLEITEQELIADHERLNLELSALRSRGALIALDDTGAGYAGLQHMIVLRPEVIKVDRALVENIDTDSGKLALLDSFTTFARRTGAKVCAEGIETLAELTVLAELGVDYGQGYVFAKPGPPWPVVDPSAYATLQALPSKTAALPTAATLDLGLTPGPIQEQH